MLLKIILTAACGIAEGIKTESTVPERRLLWRSEQEKMVAWVTAFALGRGRRGQMRDGYEGK